MRMEPGDWLGEYEIRGQLGAGGMGMVLRAWQPELHREVAVKVIRGDPEASVAVRFRREVELHAALSHPHLVKIYDAGHIDEVDYLVMELLEGITLTEEMKRRGAFPIERAISIARDLADALAYLHTHDIVHRDLKPANVMIDPGNRVKLMDLGLAHAEGHTVLTKDNQMVGTLRYLPPEATAGPVRDPRADVHSLAVVLFEMMTGRLPFRGDTFPKYLEALVCKPAPLLRTVIQGAPPALESLLDHMLQKDPANRPTAAVVMTDLEDLLTLSGIPHHGQPAAAFAPAPATSDSAPTLAVPLPARPGPGEAGPRFRVVSTLGHGAMGTVYLAVQTDLDRQVALKFLHPGPDLFTSLQRFRREARVMAELRHPGIVRLYSYIDDPERPCLVMEYLPGGTLQEKLAESPRGLPVTLVTRMARDLLGALSELHAAKVAHRDVKPANVLFRSENEAVLGDLGLVSAGARSGGQLTDPDMVLGTLAYMAPEALLDGETTTAADLYSLGVTLFEALTGTHPGRLRLAEIGEPVPDPSTLRADAPRALCDLILALADPEPPRRAPAAAAALKIMLKARSSRSTRSRKELAVKAPAATPAAPATPPPAAPRKRRGPRLAAIAGAGLVGAFLVALLRPASPPSLDLVMKARRVTVITKPAVRDRVLAVFDAGKEVSSATGTASPGSTSFEVSGLVPCRTYRAQLRSASDSSHTPVELEFRTPAEIEILGTDSGGTEGGLWLRTSPATRVRPPGASDWVDVSETPVRIPGRPHALEVRAGSSLAATIAVTSPGTPEDGPLDLGLMLGEDPGHEQILEPTGPRPLLEWLVANRIGWAVLPPDDEGRPRVTLDLGASPPAPRRILGMRPPASKDRETWLKQIRAAPSRDGPVCLAVDAEWMYSAGLDDSVDALLADELRAWRETLERDMPGAKFLVPAPLGLVFGQSQLLPLRGQPSLWLRSLDRLEAISIESLSDSAEWENDRSKLHRSLEPLQVKPDLKFIWVISAIRNQFLEPGGDARGARTTDSIGLARCFAFARATYPGVTIIGDLREIAGPGPLRRPQPTWERLAGVARALRGTRFRRHLTGSSREAPRVEAKVPVVALGFASSTRGVQILCTGTRSASIRFTPARPGILRTPGPPEDPWITRLVTKVEPMDLEINSTPLIYEELDEVQARAEPGGELAVELIQAR